MKRFLSAALALLLGANLAYADPIPQTPQGSPEVSLCQSAKAVAHTGDTAEFVLATCNVPRKWLGPNGRLIVRVEFSHTNSANNKTLRVRLGGASGTAYLAQVDTTSAAFNAEVRIANRNATNSQVGYVQTSTAAPTTSAVDTTAVVPLVITGQLALGTETVTLEGYSVEMFAGK